MHKTIGIILAILLLLITINSSWYFLGVRKVKIIEWLVFNACAPSSITFLIGFTVYLANNDRTILHIAVLPMFFFGGLGLLVFPWSGYNMIGQVSHLIMVANIVWLLFVTVKTADFQPAAIGLVLGIVIFSGFIAFQQTYVATHPDDFQKILGMPVPFS